jgi:HEAT repeats
MTLFSAEPSSPWLWEIMVAITLVLVLLNVLLIALVHGRRIRQYIRGGRERRFQARIEAVLAKLGGPTSSGDRLWLRWQLAGFDELEQPLAAVALIERLRPASPEERRQMLEVLREVGAVELLVDSTGSRIPWRRALAVRTLGWAGAEEAVPLLIERAGGSGAGARTGRRPAGAAAAR